VAVKILAADDSSTMRKVLEMTFAGEAVEIETVGDGEAAVERASQTPPDLVIADVSMTMDGYEVARALKSRPATQNVAVIVLASQHHPYDAEKGRGAGVDDHILKPYDSQAMIDKAKDVLSRPRARVAGAPAAVAAAPPAATATAAARPALPAKGPALAAPAGGAATPGAAAAPRAPGVGRPAGGQPAPRSTVAFGAVQPPKPAQPQGRPVLELADDEPAPAPARTATPAATSSPAAARPAARPAQPAAQPVAPTPAAQPATPARAPSAAVAAATAEGGPMAAKLADMGLSREQVEGVLALSRDVIERVVWEVVPDLAEVIIREEIRRLTAD
jgi:CheY-like chemotaxis protein